MSPKMHRRFDRLLFWGRYGEDGPRGGGAIGQVRLLLQLAAQKAGTGAWGNATNWERWR